MREIVALFAVGQNCTEIVYEIVEVFCPVIVLDGIFYNESAMWGEEIFDGIVIERPSDLVKHNFDKLIICGEPAYAEAMKPTLVTKLGIEEDKVVPYHEWLRANIGPHEIDWSGVHRVSDIIGKLQGCGTLNDLEEFYYNHPHRRLEKYAHYFEIYDRHLSKYRNKECVIVEVGVFKGGSLQMWKNYFGDKAQIIGIDITESTAEYAEEQIAIEIGSQSDREFWRRFKEKYPRVDIFIDDGGHTMEQQIITFEEMFDHISEDGVYLCEDMHTSYWKSFGGGYKNPESYVEYSKNFIDYINSWYCVAGVKSDCTYLMHSLHYYDSVLVIEKRKMYQSVCIGMGEEE